jgi:hypothetical protein
MAGYFMLALATVCCGCSSLPESASGGPPNFSTATSPQTQPATLPVGDNLATGDGKRSSVPMIMDDSNADKPNTLSRTLHVYWFFGAR